MMEPTIFGVTVKFEDESPTDVTWRLEKTFGDLQEALLNLLKENPDAFTDTLVRFAVTIRGREI